MTNEQREAIEDLKREYEQCNYTQSDLIIELDYAKEILSLIKEQQEEIQQKDKQIDLMAEWIEKHTKYYDEDGCYCEVEKEICKYDIECKDCIKQYFERKVEEC